MTTAGLFAAMGHSQTDDWDASSEAAILKCLGRIPQVVRVIEDGSEAPMWADAPVGIHVIVIPELRYAKTHVFVVDSSLTIHSHSVVDRLTTDAFEYWPIDDDS